jgi:hypothetical protein
MLKGEYSIADEEAKKSVQMDYRKWVDVLAKKAQDVVQNNENKELYKITTILSNRRRIKNHSVRDKKGELLTGWAEQASRWQEHFSVMLNPMILKEAEKEEPNVTHEENSGVSTHPPTEAEIRKALRQIIIGKAPGAHNILPEALRSDNETSVKLLHPLFADICDKEIPHDWNQGLIVKLPKERYQTPQNVVTGEE